MSCKVPKACCYAYFIESPDEILDGGVRAIRKTSTSKREKRWEKESTTKDIASKNKPAQITLGKKE